MRIATYNIAAGQFCNKQLHLLRDQINAYQIDLIGVQEVDQLTRRSGGVDQIKALKGSADDYTQFNQAIAFDGGGYGLGIVCRLPVGTSSHEQLESKNYEQRIIQKLVVQIGEVQGSFYNTHLTYEDTETRAEQMKYLKNVLDQDPAAFKIVTGDFNIEDIREWECFDGAYQLANGYEGVWHDTFPGKDCITHRLDQIILSKNFEIQQVGVVPKPYSDHYMLWVEVQLIE